MDFYHGLIVGCEEAAKSGDSYNAIDRALENFFTCSICPVSGCWNFDLSQWLLVGKDWAS